ncbi:MAG: peptide chain release factor 1 [Candidatus Sungbacteria bacterium]|nr:peptide chain release factor 1 [Candidatus Sungbacteria bacterium]
MEIEFQKLQQQKEELQQKLGDPEILRDPQKVKELSIEFSKIEKRIFELSRISELQKRIKEAEEMLAPEKDGEIAKLAEEELISLKSELKMLEKKTAAGAENLPQDVIMEIRAGAGGQEASLFAGKLFHMYAQFAKKRGWNILTLDESRSDLGGFKEIIFEINGENAYAYLQFESGVHRVQRIPETEKTGRIHTSTASVAVLPKAREIDIEIKPQDVKVEFFRSSGPGGQNVNKVETAVRMTHLPTGLVITSQESRSQQKNREHAMDILRTKLYEDKHAAEAKKIGEKRREQIGTADRSEKIRTYNFPQDRVTDHRIKKSWHNLESILEGNVDDIIEAFNT